MTVPMWAPFASLAAVCLVWPTPVWTRRVDWLALGVWTGLLGFCLAVWAGVFLLVWWAAS